MENSENAKEGMRKSRLCCRFDLLPCVPLELNESVQEREHGKEGVKSTQNQYTATDSEHTYKEEPKNLDKITSEVKSVNLEERLDLCEVSDFNSNCSDLAVRQDNSNDPFVCRKSSYCSLKKPSFETNQNQNLGWTGMDSKFPNIWSSSFRADIDVCDDHLNSSGKVPECSGPEVKMECSNMVDEMDTSGTESVTSLNKERADKYISECNSHKENMTKTTLGNLEHVTTPGFSVANPSPEESEMDTSGTECITSLNKECTDKYISECNSHKENKTKTTLENLEHVTIPEFSLANPSPEESDFKFKFKMPNQLAQAEIINSAQNDEFGNNIKQEISISEEVASNPDAEICYLTQHMSLVEKHESLVDTTVAVQQQPIPDLEDGGQLTLYDADSTNTMVKMTTLTNVTGYIPAKENCHNIIAQSEMEIKFEKHLFVKTSSYKVAESVFKDEGVVFLVGPPGCGKTMMARKLARSVIKSDTAWQPLVLKSPKEWRQCVKPDENQVIVLENLFGFSYFDLDRFYKWKELNMETVFTSEKKRLIFTMRLQIIQEGTPHLKAFPLFKFTRLINIVQELKEGKLNSNEKCNMLSKHVKFCKLESKISEDTVKSIASRDTVSNFPSCCQYFCSMHCLHTEEIAVHFFTNPIMYFVKEIDELYNEKNKAKFGALLVTMLMKGKLNIQHLDERKKSNDHDLINFHLSVISNTVTLAEIKRSADQFCGTYLLKKENYYTFIHPSINSAVCLVYGKYYPEHLLQVCSLSFLLEHVTVSDIFNQSKLLVKPPFCNLLQRFTKEITECRSIHVCMHEALSDGKFVSHFKEYCQNNNLDILTTETTSNLPLLYWAAWSKQCYFFLMLIKQHKNLKAKLDKTILCKIANACCISGNKDVLKCIDRCFKMNLLDIPSLSVPVPVISRQLVDDADLQSDNAVHAGKLIHVACLQGKKNIVEFLLNKASCSPEYINSLDEFGRNPCHIAARCCSADKCEHMDVFLMLVHYKCKLSVRSKCNNLPIHEACSAGQNDIVNIILEKHPGHLIEKGAEDKTPLEISIIGKHVTLVKHLLNLQTEDTENNSTKVQWYRDLILLACEKQSNSDVLSILLEKMKQISCELMASSKLKTPLHVVCEMSGDVDMAELLIGYGVDVNRTDVRHQTALHLACKNPRSSLHLIEVLIKHNVNMFIRDVSNQLAIEYVTCNTDIENYLKDAMEHSDKVIS